MCTFLCKTLSLASSANHFFANHRETEAENRQVGSDRISAYELTTRNHELEIVFSRLNLLAILNDALGRKTAIREPVLL
jgi:hypothetical protein